MPLRSQRFSTNSRLDAASKNAPPIRYGERGDAVQLVQKALLDLGFRLPHSTGNGSKAPDGIFGSETAAAVRSFQVQQSLLVDGIVGHDTLSEMDRLFAEGDPAAEMLEDIINRGSQIVRLPDYLRAAKTRELDRACSGLGRLLEGSSDARSRVSQAVSKLQASSRVRYG